MPLAIARLGELAPFDDDGPTHVVTFHGRRAFSLCRPEIRAAIRAKRQATPLIDVNKLCGEPAQTHLQWATTIAKKIARDVHHFDRGSQEESDLVSIAVLTLLHLAPHFDPALLPAGGDADGQFRGWAHSHIRGEVQREAIRLRNGGTYNTRVERNKDGTKKPRVQMVDLPRSRCENCTEILLLARPEWSEEEADEQND